ncbi:MAG: 2-oxo acid dehydrogenase subunit E2 [Alphaproteobacteria bacterium]|nr:2-oxo acid dehydrogenase subunit E2 [Alphaproteobacteria bacterium]
MGRYVFKLPDIGEGMAQAEIAAWHVRVGDLVSEDDPLVDVMTDKATVEIPSPVAGRIVALHGEVGERRAIGSELVAFEVAGAGTGEPAPEPKAGQKPAAVRPGAPEVAPSLPQLQQEPVATTALADRAAVAAVATRAPGEKPIASPAVRRRAWERGVALQFVPGSGPGGRITQEDLDAYLSADGSSGRPIPARTRRHDAVEEVKIVGLRRVIAERLQQAKRRIPHFSYIEEVDVTALEELRRDLNTPAANGRPHLTVLPFLVRALVAALPEHPQINSRFDDEAGILHRYGAVHVGIATQTPAGLLVPVLRHAETLNLWSAAAEIARLAQAARDGSLDRDALSGSTITVTSLGPLGGLASTPVINYPEVAILGVNKIALRPVVRDGQVALRQIMNVSASFDHRIVDGWEAAQFIQRMRRLLEQPARLFLAER